MVYNTRVLLIISFIVATHCLSEICDLLLVLYPLLQFVTCIIGIIAGIVPICIFTQTLYWSYDTLIIIPLKNVFVRIADKIPNATLCVAFNYLTIIFQCTNYSLPSLVVA